MPMSENRLKNPVAATFSCSRLNFSCDTYVEGLDLHVSNVVVVLIDGLLLITEPL